jgi:hypothetical protein
MHEYGYASGFTWQVQGGSEGTGRRGGQQRWNRAENLVAVLTKNDGSGYTQGMSFSLPHKTHSLAATFSGSSMHFCRNDGAQ